MNFVDLAGSERQKQTEASGNFQILVRNKVVRG